MSLDAEHQREWESIHIDTTDEQLAAAHIAQLLSAPAPTNGSLLSRVRDFPDAFQSRMESVVLFHIRYRAEVLNTCMCPHRLPRCLYYTYVRVYAVTWKMDSHLVSTTGICKQWVLPGDDLCRRA